MQRGPESQERLRDPAGGLLEDSHIPPTAAFQNVPGRRVRATFQTNIRRKCARPRKIYLAKCGHRIQSLRSERRGFCFTGKSPHGLDGEVIYRHLRNTL